MLAHYLVSSLNFIHPANRRGLSLDECRRLDEYLAKHKLPVAEVARAFQVPSIKYQVDICQQAWLLPTACSE